jgi:hypothetical protein
VSGQSERSSIAGTREPTSARDAQLLCELQRFRQGGYEPCLVVYCDRRGDLRLSATLSTPQGVRTCVTDLLDAIDVSSPLIVMERHRQ